MTTMLGQVTVGQYCTSCRLAPVEESNLLNIYHLEILHPVHLPHFVAVHTKCLGPEGKVKGDKPMQIQIVICHP